MTNSPNNQNSFKKIWQTAKHPATLITGISAIAIVVVGYIGGRIYLQQNLPRILETQLSQILGREVKVGEVNSLSLFDVELESVSLPPTVNDSDYLTIESIKVNFNLFPLLIFRPLNADVTVERVQGFIEQDNVGNLLDLNLKQQENQRELPIDLNILLNLPNVDISLLPEEQTSPINIALNGTGRYIKADNQQVQFDINTNVEEAKIKAKGDAVIDTGKTKLQLLIEDLSLPGLTALIPNSPVEINNGEVNANLNVEVPSIQDIESSRTQGNASLTQIEAQTDFLKQPLLLTAIANFQGQKMVVEEGKASLGDLLANVTGEIDWAKGYDLNVDVNSFSLANLVNNLSLSLPVKLDGEMQANLKVDGELLSPLVKGNIRNSKNIIVDRLEFKELTSQFQADLDRVTINNLEIKPLAGGTIQAKGELKTQLKNSLQEKKPIDIKQIPITLNINTNLPIEDIASPYYVFPSEVNVGTLTASGRITGTTDNLNGFLSWQLPATQAVNNISGRGEVILDGKNIRLNQTELQTLGGKVNLDGNANLESRLWQAFLTATSIPLTPFLSQINLADGKIDLSRPIALNNANFRLSGNLDSFDINKINGRGILDLNIDGGGLVAKTELNSGILNLESNLTQLPVSRFVPSLNIPVNLQATNINAEVPVNTLLSLRNNPNPDLSRIKVSLNSQLLVNQGIVKATAELNNNLWDTNIIASAVDVTSLSREFLPLKQPEKFVLPNLNAEVNLAGNIQSLFQPDLPVNIQARNIEVNLGEQFLKATGDIALSNLTTNPDIANLSLNVEAGSNLKTLPIEEILSQLPVDNTLIPQEIKLAGKADFKGNLRGKNLLSAPNAADNIVLTGNLALSDFSLNNREFDPVLRGPVQIATGNQFSIDLRGSQDVIAADVEACRETRCRLPYLPVSFEFRQGEEDKKIIASGYREGDRFLAEVDSFPLDLLGIAPAAEFGIPGILGGGVDADLDVNLFNFATNGNVTVTRPGIGQIIAKELAAQFSYDVDNSIAQLASASLKFGNSEYKLKGDLNLRSLEVNANLNIADAQVEDIFSTLQLSSINDIANLFQKVNYATAKSLQIPSVGNSNDPISEQVNLLSEIEKRIKELAAKIQDGGSVPQLDIEGIYSGEVNVAGTLKDPQIDFKVAGNDWEWNIQPDILNIIAPVGLVRQTAEVIPIPELIVQGNFADGTLKVEPLRLQVQEMLFTFAGEVSNQRKTKTKALENKNIQNSKNNKLYINNTEFALKNLSLDLIDSFVEIPVDIAGEINIEGNLDGSINNPELQGEIEVLNVALNGQSLNQNITGEFNYADARLLFATTEPSFINIKAEAPFPIQQGLNDLVKLDVNITTEAFPLINILTGGQVQWLSGDGEIDLSASARLDLTTEQKLKDLSATGNITLKNASLNSPALNQDVKLNAEIALNGEVVEVKNLEGTVDETKLLITGVLPLLQPQESSNPLTVTLERGNVQIDNLYQGMIDGRITITGYALRPVIGGGVTLSNAQVFIPKTQQPDAANTTLVNRWVRSVATRESQPVIIPTLNNFQVVLDSMELRDWSLYLFQFSGNLTLNGTLNNLKNIQPEGTITLERGEVTLFNTQFFLAPRYQSTINFRPDLGLTNPDLDIRMETALSAYSDRQQQQGVGLANETRDNIFRSNKPETVKVTLAIDGLASQLLPNLGRNAAEICQIDSSELPFPQESDYTNQELNSLSECVTAKAFGDESDRSVLNSPVVKLTSSPPLSENEIAQLLGGQFLGLAEQLQNGDTSELLQLGVLQFILGPLQRDVLYQLDKTTNNIGRSIGLQNLRAYPVVETTVQLDQQSLVRFSYDYLFNEGEIRYELRF